MYSPGDLLVIDPTANHHVALAQQPYSPLVEGIYSTKPRLLGTTRQRCALQGVVTAFCAGLCNSCPPVDLSPKPA